MEHRPRRRSPRSSSAEQELSSVTTILKSSLLGAGGGLLASLLLLLGGTILCLCTTDPGSLILPTGLLALYLSAMVGGFLAIRHHKKEPLPCGALCGALMMLFFLFLSFFFASESGKQFSLGISLLLRALIPFFSILGARLGWKRKIFSGRRKR